MAPILSKPSLTSVPFNCYEVTHTWNPNCHLASLQFGGSVFKEALKLYTIFYIGSLLFSGRRKGKNTFLGLLKNILRSSLHLGILGTGCIEIICLLRKLTGSFNVFTVVFLPAFFASYLAILVETGRRRETTALYHFCLAVDVLYKMLKSRGLVGEVRQFPLILFCVATTATIFRMKGKNSNPQDKNMLTTIFKKLFGPEEFKEKNEDENDNNNPESKKGKKSSNCPHSRQSCLDYWTEARFFAGFALQLLLQVMTLVKQGFGRSEGIAKSTLLKSSLKTGLGFGLLNLTFRGLNCLLRRGNDDPDSGKKAAAFSAAVSSIIGFLLLKPGNILVLYFLLKSMEPFIRESHRKNNWKLLTFLDKYFPGGGYSLLFSLSTALAIHAIVIEPQAILPKFYILASKCSGGRTDKFNRQILDIFGTNSSHFTKTKWPKLNTKHVSDEMKQFLKMRE